MATWLISYEMTNNTGRDDLRLIVEVVIKRGGKRDINILQTFANASINDVPSLLLLGQQEIDNLYHVKGERIKENLPLADTIVLVRFYVFASKLADNHTKKPAWQELTYSLFQQSRIDQFLYPRKNTLCARFNKLLPQHNATHLAPTVIVFHPTLMPDKAHNPTAHNISVEVSGREIESHKCNSGETSNTLTMIGCPEFDYGKTNNKPTLHGSAHKTAPMVDYSINCNLSLIMVNTCGVKPLLSRQCIAQSWCNT
jgi:hypothetical protein